MTDKYITIAEAVEKYQLNNSKFVFAVRKAAQNGLYKAVFRKRDKIFLRQDYLENWLIDNDVKSPCRVKQNKDVLKKPKTKKELRDNPFNRGKIIFD